MKRIELNNLSIEINNKKILNSINIKINEGETILIVGPNGHGKSTLFKSILKHYSTKISSGNLVINNELANEWTTDKIAKSGIFLANQYPIEIPGLKTFDLLRNELSHDGKEIKVLDFYKQVTHKLKELGLNDEFLKRNINENFSGGERKKMEILQMLLLNPDFIFLDEIDSGLDSDALQKITKILLEQKQKNKTIIYISHNDKLLQDLIPDRVYLIVNGSIVLEGDKELANRINNEGYEWIEKELNISIKKESEDINLLNTAKDFYCNGK